jgi:hypothetical protein
MSRPPKVENCQYRADIERLAQQGYTANWISKWCGDRGMIISARAIARHLDKIPGLNRNDSKAPYAKSVQAGNSQTMEEITPNPSQIDLQRLNRELGVGEELLTFTDVLDASQRYIAKIFMTQCAIVYQLQLDFANGDCRYPNEHIRGLRMLTEVLDKVWGHAPAMDLAKDMESLQMVAELSLEDTPPVNP